MVVEDWCKECNCPIGQGNCGGCCAAACCDDGPPAEAFCPHCGKEYEDFSDLGCEHCDQRYPVVMEGEQQYPDDCYERSDCPVCGSDQQWVECWHCFGDGGYHDCGDDCCCCLHPELDLNVDCPECGGEGGYLECLSLPHTAEQMADYERRKPSKESQ
jgi:hypothetical protein